MQARMLRKVRFSRSFSLLLFASSHESLLVSSLFHLVQNLLHIDRCRLLSLWEVLEAHQELSHDGLCGNHYPELIAVPALIHLGVRCHFERILSKVDDQGHGARLRNVSPPRVLRRKGELPITVSKCVKATGIVKVEDL